LTNAVGKEKPWDRLHDKQALVLVNRGGAKGSDIIALSDAVRASVREKFGIDIHPEVNFIN
jgi:UDP-N-acetylmuramate dehydrogenase